MYKWISWYNQNRKKFWIIIIIIVFIFIIIRLLNFWAKMQLEEEKKKANEENTVNASNTVSYEKQSKSIVSGGNVDKEYQDKFGEVINAFLSNCVSGNYEEAYQYLSKDTKEEIYPSKKIFIDQYCSEKFEGNKEYNFQSWSSKGNYIYLIKIHENMLSTGNARTNYIQDYYTIVKENDEYKLNISSFIGKQKYNNKDQEKYGVYINLESTSVYMDYQLYKITIKNSTENTIMLDTRKRTDQTYIVNNNGVKIEALLHENKEEDLIINPEEEKTITIKFSNVYQYETNIDKMVFSNIVINYDKYSSDKESYQDYGTIKIEI